MDGLVITNESVSVASLFLSQSDGDTTKKSLTVVFNIFVIHHTFTISFNKLTANIRRKNFFALKNPIKELLNWRDYWSTWQETEQHSIMGDWPRAANLIRMSGEKLRGSNAQELLTLKMRYVKSPAEQRKENKVISSLPMLERLEPI